MEAIVERCCGLDVHKAEVVACILVGDGGRKPKKEVRRFSTFTKDLVMLREWLVEHGVTQVGMESTASYWKPIYAVLEEDPSLEIVVGNAQHIKNVPGRKTDVNDAEWIATLVRMGLVRKSFVPPPDLRDLRDLLRYRRSTVQARSSERNRLQKLLETANIKLGSVASDVFGQSGMAMLRAIVDGESDPARLANLAQGLLRRKLEPLQLALDGRLRDHHRFILRTHLQRLDELDAHVAKLDEEIERRMESYRAHVERLSEIPGVKKTVATHIIAEMGVQMDIFPTVGHLAAWAYQILKTGMRYRELGETYLDQLDQTRVKGNLVRRLQRLGYDVNLQKRAAESIS